MRLIYVDESYCKICYYVVALLVPDTEARALTAALDEVVQRTVASYDGICLPAELHGHDLFQGKGDWEPIKKMTRARIGIYGHALEAIADHNVTVIIRGVMAQRLRDRYGDRAPTSSCHSPGAPAGTLRRVPGEGRRPRSSNRR